MILFPLSIGGIADAIDFALKHVPASEIYINDYEGGRYQWGHVGKTTLDQLKSNLVKYIENLDTAIQSQILPRLAQIESTVSNTKFPDLADFDQMTDQNHRSIFKELYQ